MLFETKDLYEKKIAASISAETENDFSLCTPEDTIKAKFGHIAQNSTRHYVSGGVWALHDLVKYCLSEIGPAEMIGFSWSLTTPAAEKLLHFKNSGLLKEMSFIFDCGMSQWSRGALPILKNSSKKIVTTMIHAKGFVMWNESYKISCISSANFSNNPRIEAGYLSTEIDVFEFHKNWVERTLKEGNLFVTNTKNESTGIEIPKIETTNKAVYIIRGLPGSGKSLLAESIADTVCETEEFFTNGNRYAFFPEAIQLAIANCLNKFKEAIEENKQKIAVANVFLSPNDYKEYENIARKNGYRVFVLTNQNANGTSNIHGIKQETIEKMRDKFQVKL